MVVDSALAKRGSIPACAGEPQRHQARSVASTVYPRLCGGTPADAAAGAKVCGLSPRVRGNPSMARGRAAV